MITERERELASTIPFRVKGVFEVFANKEEPADLHTLNSITNVDQLRTI